MVKIRFDKDRVVAYDGDKEIGKCDFIEIGGAWNIVHTEVDDLYQGRGIARKLVESVVENAKKFDKRLVADCSYAKKVIENI